MINRLMLIIDRLDLDERIKLAKLLGIVFSSILIGLSIFYLIVDFVAWFVYAPFLIFGIISIFLFESKKKTEKINAGKIKIRKIRFVRKKIEKKIDRKEEKAKLRLKQKLAEMSKKRR